MKQTTLCFRSTSCTSLEDKRDLLKTGHTGRRSRTSFYKLPRWCLSLQGSQLCNRCKSGKTKTLEEGEQSRFQPFFVALLSWKRQPCLNRSPSGRKHLSLKRMKEQQNLSRSYLHRCFILERKTLLWRPEETLPLARQPQSKALTSKMKVSSGWLCQLHCSSRRRWQLLRLNSNLKDLFECLPKALAVVIVEVLGSIILEYL